MICIPISAHTNEEMLVLIARAEKQPAGMYELRFDSLQETPLVEKLVAACSRPIMATCRSVQEGGGYREGFAKRRDILRRAAEAGVACVDAEASDLESLGRFTKTVRIVSMHDFRETPRDLSDRISALSATSADWIKFAVTALTPSDNIRVFDALAHCSKPAIGIAMGDMGLISRILGPRYGSQVTFGSLDSGLESAPGQPTARDLAEVYRIGSITERTDIYCMYGSGEGNADGHIRYNRAFADLGMDAVCIPLLDADDNDYSEVISYVCKRNAPKLTA